MPKNILIGFVVIIILLLIFNYFYPIFSFKTLSFNGNNNQGELYQIKNGEQPQGDIDFPRQPCCFEADGKTQHFCEACQECLHIADRDDSGEMKVTYECINSDRTIGECNIVFPPFLPPGECKVPGICTAEGGCKIPEKCDNKPEEGRENIRCPSGYTCDDDGICKKWCDVNTDCPPGQSCLSDDDIIVIGGEGGLCKFKNPIVWLSSWLILYRL